MEKIKILVIDDNVNICELIVEYGEYKFGYVMHSANSLEDAVQQLEVEKYDLVTLDIGLGIDDGLISIELIQKEHQGPIIFVTAVDEISYKIQSFEKGADDYIVKPINLEELFLRINRSLKRNLTFAMRINDYTIEINPLMIRKKNCDLNLTNKEMKILYLFLTNPNKILTREYIHKQVWKDLYFLETRTVDVHISKIRSRAKENNIKSVRGEGYIYEP